MLAPLSSVLSALSSAAWGWLSTLPWPLRLALHLTGHFPVPVTGSLPLPVPEAPGHPLAFGLLFRPYVLPNDGTWTRFTSHPEVKGSQNSSPRLPASLLLCGRSHWPKQDLPFLLYRPFPPTTPLAQHVAPLLRTVFCPPQIHTSAF